MSSTYVFVIDDDGKTVVSSGVLDDFVSDKRCGTSTHVLIKTKEGKEEIHPVNMLFYREFME